VAAGLVGRLLPWDQLALWAVTTGSNGEFDGVRAVFSSQAKFVTINGREVSPSTYEFWAYAHLGLAVLVGVALTLVWLRTKERGPVAPPAPEGELVRSS
jgi:quinol-cytochrome oxidoreductase complex cytochrome b subunit